MTFLSFFRPEEVVVVSKVLLGLDDQGVPEYDEIETVKNAFVKQTSSSTNFLMNSMDRTAESMDLIFDIGETFTGKEYFKVRGNKYKFHGTQNFAANGSIKNQFLSPPVVISIERDAF